MEARKRGQLTLDGDGIVPEIWAVVVATGRWRWSDGVTGNEMGCTVPRRNDETRGMEMGG